MPSGNTSQGVAWDSLVEAFFRTMQTSLDQHRAGVGPRVENYFASVRAELDLAREEIQLHQILHADYWSVFDYIEPDENRLSEILADLLDPRGKHGQGDRFLSLLAQSLTLRAFGKNESL